MLRTSLTVFMLGAMTLFASGCCCVQGLPSGASCDSGFYASTSCGGCNDGCSSGTCGGGPLAKLASCRGACGDVYVDEWISEPPTVDNCGYSCGGCGHCKQCTPVRSLLKMLWGRSYGACCPTELVGPTCGCDSGSCGGGCGCDSGGHTSHSTPMHLNSAPAMQPVPAKSEVEPKEVVPTPAPDPMARHINPARRRMQVRTASHR